MRKRVTAATYSVTHRDGSILRARALVGVDGRIKALQNCDEAWCVESDFEWRQCDKVSKNKVKEIRLELSRRLRFTAVRARALVGVVGQWAVSLWGLWRASRWPGYEHPADDVGEETALHINGSTRWARALVEALKKKMVIVTRGRSETNIFATTMR
jgi:hypothetical protein